MQRVMSILVVAIAVSFAAQAEVGGRLSCIVSFTMDRDGAPEWLKQPGLAFVETYVRFGPELHEGVLFGTDHEFIEGVEDPIHVEGGDWMGLVGLNRKGEVWVSVGTPDTMKGIASKDRTWVRLDLGARLEPDTWYRLHCITDFGNRRFVQFTVEGPGIAKTFDLSEHTLDYPNHMPFDKRALTNYVWSMHGTGFGGAPDDHTAVYFDDVRYGFVERVEAPDGGVSFKETEVDLDDFERGAGRFEPQPLNMEDIMATKKIRLEHYTEGTWYLERDTSRSRTIEAPFAKSGKTVVECDATLQDTTYDVWYEQRERESAGTEE